MCKKCNNKKCGCDDPIVSCCDITIPTTCVEYDGSKLEVLEIVRGDNLNKIIREIDVKIKNVTPNEIEAATPTSYGVVAQSDGVDNVISADAVDLQSALVLINELKLKLNAKLKADRKSGQQYE